MSPAVISYEINPKISETFKTRSKGVKMKRRSFLKGALGIGALSVASSTLSFAKSAQPEYDNGVVRGHSPKKEILYKKTKNWEIYYKNAI
jgi:hypothetical protein